MELFLFYLYKWYIISSWDDLGIFSYYSAYDIFEFLFNAKKSNLINSYELEVVLTFDSDPLIFQDEREIDIFFIDNDISNVYEINIKYEVNNTEIKKKILDDAEEWEKWEMNNKNYYDNYYLINKQIWYTIDYLYQIKNEFLGEVFNINTKNMENIDLISVMIFLDIKEVIDIDQIIFEEWENNFSFRIKDNNFKNYYNKYSLKWSERIYFNEKSWEVFLNDELLWSINIGTQQYTFFKYLYDNKWIYKTHDEIHKHIYWDYKKLKDIRTDIADIKSELNEKIKKLIKSIKWWYIFR